MNKLADKVAYSLRMAKGQFENIKDLDTDIFDIIEDTQHIIISFDDFPAIGNLVISADDVVTEGDREYFGDLTEWYRELSEEWEKYTIKNESNS